MAKQYNKMNAQYKELCAIYERTKDTNGQEFVNKQPIYQTCPLITFMQRMEIILEMYRAELNTKRSLVSDKNGIKTILTREEGVVLLSIWINQPSLTKSILQEWQDICTTEMEFTTSSY
ncbi:unnamed protein product [Mucor hiemalis]